MFYAAETCAMPVTTLNHHQCYGRAVVHLICNVKENDDQSRKMIFSSSFWSNISAFCLNYTGYYVLSLINVPSVELNIFSRLKGMKLDNG